MIQWSPGGSVAPSLMGRRSRVSTNTIYARWYNATHQSENCLRVCACACVRARNARSIEHGCCHELAWKCLRRCIRAQVCRFDITKGALWRTQWWCIGADFNRIMSTDRRDSTELFRVNAPPTPERKLLMETGQLPLAHAPRVRVNLIVVCFLRLPFSLFSFLFFFL